MTVGTLFFILLTIVLLLLIVAEYYFTKSKGKKFFQDFTALAVIIAILGVTLFLVWAVKLASWLEPIWNNTVV